MLIKAVFSNRPYKNIAFVCISQVNKRWNNYPKSPGFVSWRLQVGSGNPINHKRQNNYPKPPSFVLQRLQARYDNPINDQSWFLRPGCLKATPRLNLAIPRTPQRASPWSFPTWSGVWLGFSLVLAGWVGFLPLFPSGVKPCSSPSAFPANTGN